MMETNHLRIFMVEHGKSIGYFNNKHVLLKRTALEAMPIVTKSLLNRAESGALHVGTYSVDAQLGSVRDSFCSVTHTPFPRQRAALLFPTNPLRCSGVGGTVTARAASFTTL